MAYSLVSPPATMLRIFCTTLELSLLPCFVCPLLVVPPPSSFLSSPAVLTIALLTTAAVLGDGCFWFKLVMVGAGAVKALLIWNS